VEGWIPTSLSGRAVAIALSGALLAFIVATIATRLPLLFQEWTADGDQNQAVWHYWRYHISGAFPGGDLLTDYAFAMHAPPVWWLLMSSLSTFVEPVNAAKILNLIAYVGTIITIVVVVGKRANIFVGLAAGFLIARSLDFNGIIAGGYARSFGPLLTILFLGTFMAGKHRLTLAVLVFQAAFYPSVVIPCGIAYGLYTVVAGPMAARRRRMAGMFVAGLLIIAFGKSQDLVAKEWWGPVMFEKEALTMPAWQGGGRISEAPLKPVPFELRKNVGRALRGGGNRPAPVAVQRLADQRAAEVVVLGSIFFALTIAAVTLRRRRQGQPVPARFPWQIPLLAVGMLAAYFLARAVAFKLYLPYRALQHVLPYLVYVSIPIAFWVVFSNTLKRRALVSGLTFAVSVLPIFVIYGDGLERGPTTYARYSFNEGLYRFVRKLPQDAMIAGDFIHVSSIPLFAHHNVYVNKNLAHPFRRGFYAECERRILETYRALYATSLESVVDFARRENVDYLVFRKDAFKTRDNRLFQPIKRELDQLWTNNRKTGFALASVPKEAVVYRRGNSVMVDLKKLATWVEQNRQVGNNAPADDTAPPADLESPPGK
jgi:hypothetical protein